MRRFEAFSLIALAAGALPVSAAVGYVNVGLAAFGCFYAPPIGGAKCVHVPGPDPFRIGFYDALGLFSIPWTLVLVFYLIPNRWRIQ